MSYYLAPSLAQLRSEIDKAHPGRSKASDGWIGDASHQARPSDHNPDYSAGGVVRAIDITAKDIDVPALLALLKSDSRVNYIIHNRTIYGATHFAPRPYTGDNPHTKHVHVSIKHTKAAENGKAWGYKGASTTKPAAPKPPAKDRSGAWPQKPLTAHDYISAEMDGAWRELMNAIGYHDKDLGKNLLAWLSDLTDPRTGHGYYDLRKWVNDGVMGEQGVKALQRKLYDTKGDGGKPAHLYNGKADGKREALTIRAEYAYLNLKANRGVK